MPSIKIVRTPPGQAPRTVRDEWIDVEIPLLFDTDRTGVGVLDGKKAESYNQQGGYVVDIDEAIKALEGKARKYNTESCKNAVRWWKDWLYNNPSAKLMGGRFIFAAEVCAVIS